jgi:SAM-dependent methyltransferase
MKNTEQWRPSKFIQRKNKLIGSRDIKEVGVSSRLMADIVATHYDLHLKQHVNGRLVDLGCGKVPLFAAYKNYISECICVDWANTVEKNIHLDRECNLNDPLPFVDAEFNTIVLSDVLEHLSKPESLWKEMSRILAPGGKLIMNVPFYYCLHAAPFDFFRYTEYALAYFAQSTGFRVLLLKPMGGVPEILTDILAKNANFIPGVGKYLAMVIQKMCSLLLKTRFGKKISAKTSKTFPLGYFMIAEKI